VVSAVVVLTIALGIGGTTALFAFTDVVLLRPLPVRAPEELAFLSTLGPEGARTVSPPYPIFERIRSRSRSFDGMAAYAVDQLAIVVDGEPEQVEGQIASGSYFDVLGLEAVRGRTFSIEDERLPPSVAVVSYAYWQRRFGGSADVLGKVIRYGDRLLQIIGVTGPSFVGLELGRVIDVTIPISVAGEGMLGNERARWFSVIARLRSGRTLEGAQVEADGIFRSAVMESDASAAARTAEHIRLIPAAYGAGRLRQDMARPILLLSALMAAVMTIVCANIANLLLARGEARQRELASRAALGAGPVRIARQLLTETILLFALGASGGVVLAAVVAGRLEGFLVVGRIPILLDLGLNARALSFAAVLCITTGIVSGAVPALWGSRGGGFADLRVRGASEMRRRAGLSLGRALVVLQIAACVVILINGGLLVRTLRNLDAIAPGFRSSGVVTLSVQPLSGESSRDAWLGLWSDLLHRAELGSEGAALSVLTPLSGRDRGREVTVPGYQPRSEEDLDVRLNYVTPEYFEMFGIRLLSGRSFDARDDAAAPRVALINEAAARYYFGAESPLGSYVGVDSSGTALQVQLVGVVENVSHRSLREEAPRFLYLPLWQALDHPNRLTLSLRAGEPLAAVAAVRRELRSADAELLVSDVLTMTSQIDQALLRERLASGISTALGALGLLLAAVGLYGLVSYSVARRTNEIGIRLALGARAASIQRLMLRDALERVALGVAAGLPVALIVSRAIRSLLFQVSPYDPLAIAVGTVALTMIAGVAAYLPARRASRIDPALTLSGG
jgi:predicted permease